VHPVSIIAEIGKLLSPYEKDASTYIQLFLNVMGICAAELRIKTMVDKKSARM
jgi:hypothetical protein